jgi:hypothetical protein
MKGGATCAHIGGSAIFPKGISEEGVLLKRLSSMSLLIILTRFLLVDSDFPFT